MQRFVLCLFLVLAAPTLSAQTLYKTDPGVYVSLDRIDYGSRLFFALDGDIGYRLASGLDLGVGLGLERSAFSGVTRFGVDALAGYTLPLTGRAGLRGDARLSTGFSALYYDGGGRSGIRDGDLELRETGLDLTAALYRHVPLGGRLALYPSAGVYLDVARFWNRESGVFTETFYAEGNRLPLARANAGLELRLPLAVRVFENKQLVFEPALRYGNGPFAASPGYQTSFGLKFNF